MSYIEKPSYINIHDLANRRCSLCPKDYRSFETPIKNVRTLRSLLSQKELTGKEIGSESYINFASDYRFLRTANLKQKLTVDYTQVQSCIPFLGKHPVNDSIFIAKDGGGDGLGEVAYYHSGDPSKDYISAGILNIKISDDYLYYVLGMIKSVHFKEYVNLVTPEGSTIRHSKTLSLDYPIPITQDKDKFEKIGTLVKDILNKEAEVINRHNDIDYLVNEELRNNQKEYIKNYTITLSSIIENATRMDVGMYAKEYIDLHDLVKNYTNGYYQIPICEIKSGSTPKIRINRRDARYLWVTPTEISDFGYFSSAERVSMPTTNNLSNDALLFVNRTSKGGKGEYVGISFFYDHSFYGDGQHNQGIYRIDYLPKEELLYICSFMNSTVMRKMCGKISYGTKMKEMKGIDFANLLIPKFSDEIKQKIVNLYYFDDGFEDTGFVLTKETFNHNKNIGLFQLEQETERLRTELNKLVDEIIKESL